MARTREEILAAFAESGSTVACLCSSDKVYAADAARVAEALRAAGARYVWLAGSVVPDDARIDGTLFMGCNAVDVIDTTLTELVAP